MRLKKLRKNLKKNDRFPYLISNLTNIYYLTGFKGTYGYLIVDEKNAYFITDSRYEEYAGSVLPESVELILQKKDFTEALKKTLRNIDKKRLFVEHSMPLSFFSMMRENFNNIKIESGGDEVKPIRAIKDDDELKHIKKAAQIADNCFKHLLNIIRPGVLEWDLAIEIEYFYRKNDCRKSAFDSVVASGKGSSMPHYVTSMTKRIEKDEILLIDMGCEYDHYNSDLTRTIFIGNIDPEFKKIYNIVKRAHDTAISSLKPGISTGKIDSIARNIITKEGYGQAFGHALGHGVGLEVHEQPTVRIDDKFRLKKNVVITIEPGVYIPNSGGVRIEDMLIIGANGFEQITKSSNEIIII